jgi:glycyl-tRNA synthetase beta chain
MEKSELVVELGVEEIPASMLESAAHQFADILTELLKQQRLSVGNCTVWYTPRRIIAWLAEIPTRQEDLVETVIGPPKSIAYDDAGVATKAALAFAQKNGVPLSQIRSTLTPKGEYLAITRRVRGEKSHRILETLVPAAIGKIEFSKTMHWSADHFRFVRPIRWILALFGDKVIRFRVAEAVSSRYTTGHRFIGAARITVNTVSSLKDLLRENSVLVDPEERLALIKEGLLREAEACGGRPLDDMGLLETVVNLNESPSVIRGSFEDRFLALPQEILITVMREHQKYFSVLNDSGQLLPYFLAVVNLPADRDDIIRAGHERVLRARLADAAFFWDTDQKTRMLDRELVLRNVLFQEKLGSYYDKTQRVLKILPEVTQALGRSDLLEDLNTAAHLFKCDLVTEMVKEFPDLQGIVGGLYARAEGYSSNVWRAIYEQYLPKSTAAPSPSSDTGTILALVDRLDSVCGCFSAGIVPSGSGDPFAIRRQGNGILKIIFDHRLHLSLDRLARWSLETYGLASKERLTELREFFEGRLRFLFEEMGFAYDCINAVVAAGFDDPLDSLERLKALLELRNEADFLSLASNFRRIANILTQAGTAEDSPNPAMLRDSAESALWEKYLQVQPEVEAARKKHDYSSALRSLASMRFVVDEFFLKVMVMAEDPAIRINRLALLNCIAQLFRSIADISRIVIERETKR